MLSGGENLAQRVRRIFTPTAQDFTLHAETRRRHLHIVGQTGSGKSTLFANLIAQDLAAGRGVGLLDPHGSLALGALGSVPSRRAHEVVYLDPADMKRPIGFNVLYGVRPDQHAIAADGVVVALPITPMLGIDRRLSSLARCWAWIWMSRSSTPI
ncbi:MAG: DUF87 domain-containing protein [Hyphomicrobiaceae bacterium]